jgi:PAS domain S-box-containing protein
VLTLPVLTRLGVLGLIYVASGKEENLSNDRWRIFSLIVSQISASVENAHLFHQIEQERARLAAILTSSTDAILVVDSNGRIVLDNPAAWSVMGASSSQSGKLLSEGTTNETLVQLFESAMQGGKRTGEISLLNESRTFFANLSPVALADEVIIGWVATMQDVSHFKELDQLKSDFVHTVSHDLRSPLASILIATKMLPQIGSLSEQQGEFLATIEQRVSAMSQLIDDLLDVGKIEAGVDMEMEPYPLTPVINEVFQFFLPQAEIKSIQLINQVGTQLPIVMANPVRLRQVMQNLIGNAIKYTPDGGRVTLKAFQKGDEAHIQVIDTGIGIPAADQPRVFEKFYRVRGEHVASIKGTGLGLAITKSIVEKHNGRVWLESVFGKGSTFTVTLPIYKV